MAEALRVGTRNSLLATTQTQWVADAIARSKPALRLETLHIRTLGDRDQNTSLSKIDAVGVFTKELDNALLEGRIDFAVHSLKDLPTEFHSELLIAAIPERVDPRDAFVSARAGSIKELPAGGTVGTSSPRRKAQLLAIRTDLRVVDLRGNLDTRMGKAATGELDAILVACAGLIRLGRESDITQPLPAGQMLPAVGQGALAIVTCKDNSATLEAVEFLDHAETRAAVEAERDLLAILGGGCQVPIGALCQVTGSDATLQAVVASSDGKTVIRQQLEADTKALAAAVERMADGLRAAGAEAVLEKYR